MPTFSYIAASTSGRSPASKLTTPLPFLTALSSCSAHSDQKPAQRCVDTFSARCLGLPILTNASSSSAHSNHHLLSDACIPPPRAL